MQRIIWIISLVFGLLFFVSCHHKQNLKTITVSEFAKFVDDTGYITDAEKYGWSIVQKTIYDYITVDKATWQKPDGITLAKPNYPVTQVSYNDAMAYCQWADVELPSYETYWEIAKHDKRRINVFYDSILPPETTNIVGNVWEITKPKDAQSIQLAGGSFLCNKNTCDGTNPKRRLIVDPTTGNIHISFSVLVNE